MTGNVDIETIFNTALAKGTAGERAAYLDGACGTDAKLRERVEALLKAHVDAGSFLVQPAAGEAATLATPTHEAPGKMIGSYKLLQLIGEGGFGAVYMAEQEKPVRRKVALKIIKLGMDTKQVIARFEAERQALAMMDHPNIAKVLDAGATETGRPYFVMELVKGIPIMEYCDKTKLSTRARLDLFMDVCHAVQHAHQKGIIHRDIKPSNVLVTLHDTRPVPMVIDFGIAKATSHRLTDKTLFTEFRQFIGTPEYMSPDQVEISGLDVDTRTDIYSLGVLLYELLTGTTPFDPKTLRSAGYGEIQRIIKEEEPPKPSTRLSTQGDGESTDVARLRHTDPKSLRRLMRGDLDWIVMKAMEKDRARRYQTAAELAGDIVRHLNDEPVTAGPPSMAYKTSKFIRRHRYSVIAASLLAAVIIIGLTGTTLGFVKASREAAHTRAVNDFLQQLTLETGTGRSTGITAGEIYARGRELFGDDHAVIGSLLMTRASSLNTVGRLDEAIEIQRDALASYRKVGDGDQPTTAAALSSLGKFLGERRDYAEAEEYRREALTMKRRLYGDDSKEVADELSELTSLLVETRDPQRNAEVRDLWYETVETYAASVGDEDRKTVVERCHLGKWLHENGFRAESEPLLVKAVEQSRRVLDEGDIARFVSLNALAQVYYLRNELEPVIPLVDELIEFTANQWGRGHAATLNLTIQVVGIEARLGRVADAQSRLAEFLVLRREGAAAACDLILLSLEEQAFGVLKPSFDDNPTLGRDFILRLLDDVRIVITREHANYPKVMQEVAEWLADHGFDEDAEPLYEELLQAQRSSDADQAAIAYTLVRLGARKVNLGKAAEAEPLLRECVKLRRGFLEEGNWLLGSAESILGESLTDQGRYEEAEPLLVAGYETMAADAAAPDLRRQESVDRLIKLYEAWGRPEQAASWRAQRDAEHDGSSQG